jgi:hypothetical protein
MIPVMTKKVTITRLTRTRQGPFQIHTRRLVTTPQPTPPEEGEQAVGRSA